jgi:hypothetical protein
VLHRIRHRPPRLRQALPLPHRRSLRVIHAIRVADHKVFNISSSVYCCLA